MAIRMGMVKARHIEVVQVGQMVLHHYSNELKEFYVVEDQTGKRIRIETGAAGMLQYSVVAPRWAVAGKIFGVVPIREIFDDKDLAEGVAKRINACRTAGEPEIWVEEVYE